jgi:hypothetical protein
MKNLLYFFSISLMPTLIFSSCTKEKIVNEDGVNLESGSVIDNVESLDGILVFKNQSDFYTAANILNASHIDFIQDWAAKHNFVSQEMILNRINEAEDEFDQNTYGYLNKDLTVEELKAMGIGIKHSDLYNKYLEKGFITEYIEQDGAVSFDANVVNPCLMNVLNEDGFVIVNDTLYQYTSNLIKSTPGYNLNKKELLRNAELSDMENKILVIKFEKDTKLKGYTTRIIDYETGWHYDGNNKRVKIEYDLWDGDVAGQYFEPATYAYVTHYIEVKAVKKVLGKWDYRNNYTPIDWLSGNSTTCVEFVYGYDSDLDCWNNSYYCDLFGGWLDWTNSVKVNLSPCGEIHKSGGWKYNGIYSTDYYFESGIYKIGTINVHD